MNKSIIIPNWPCPANIKAYSTTRYGDFNLGFRGNNAQQALHNRQLLTEYLQLPTAPKWLRQIHSDIAIAAEEVNEDTAADASYTRQAQQVCVAMTADCLPILITNNAGTEVAAIHAGWRGLAKGIIDNTLKKLYTPPSQLMAWIGPAIGPHHYEVGEDVYHAFKDASFDLAETFIPFHEKWLANMPLLAKQRLNHLGINQVYLSGECTYSNPEKFFSFRREGATVGSLASLIWIEKV